MVHSRKQPGGGVVDAGGNSAGESPIISGRLLISDGPLGIQLIFCFLLLFLLLNLSSSLIVMLRYSTTVTPVCSIF